MTPFGGIKSAALRSFVHRNAVVRPRNTLRRPVRLVCWAALSMFLTLALAGSASATGSNSGSVTIDELVPLTGPSASIGPEDDIPGFKTAAAAINASGGILGSTLNLQPTDLGADPADSVTNTRQMLASTPGLAGVVGLTSDTALITANILEQAHMPAITQAGTSELDNANYKYLFRDFPPDSTESVAMAAVALQKGWNRAAILVGQNSGAQSVIQPLVKSFTRHGGKVVSNQPLPLDQSSYNIELSKMLATHPKVIFYESDPQTGATVFKELKALNNLGIPVIATSGTSGFWKTVSAAVGGYNVMNKFFSDVTAPTNYNGAGYATFLKYYKPLYKKLLPTVYVAGNYDSVIIMALAMEMAHSTKPAVYVKDIPAVVGDHSALRVSSYAQGLAAIKAHKKFYYDGTLGPISFNAHHSIAGAYVLQKTNANGTKFVTVETLSDSTVKKYE